MKKVGENIDSTNDRIFKTMYKRLKGMHWQHEVQQVSRNNLKNISPQKNVVKEDD
jgi:hypothetical protein